MPTFDFRNDRSWWNEQANWGDQARDRLEGSVLTTQEDQAKAYSQIANEGLYGDVDVGFNIGEIMRGSDAEQAGRKKQYETYLNKKFAKRLGGRAGGAREVMMANQFTAPMYADDLRERRGLRKEKSGLERELRYKNALSKLYGLQGRDKNLDAMIRQLQLVMQEEGQDDGGGVMDWINTGLDVAAMIPGPHQPVAAGASAVQ